MNDWNEELLRRVFGLDCVEIHAAVTSTNDRARQVAVDLPRAAKALIVADRQTAGRGRGGNRWWTGPGSLALSLLIDPQTQRIAVRYRSMIPLAAAVAIVEILLPRLPRTPLGLHWPNDVFAADRKLAGILVEALPDGRHVVGIGLNVNNSVDQAPPDLSSVATSLVDLTSQAVDRAALTMELLAALDCWLDRLASDPQILGLRADALCLQHGRTLVIRSGQDETAGTCAGIAPDGALLLDTAAGRRAFYSGVLVHGQRR